MRYEEVLPSPKAAEIVAQFWRFEAGDIDGGVADHVIPPDGMVSIWSSIERDGAAFAGVTGPAAKAHRTEVRSGQTVIGARLQPEAAGALLGVAVSSLYGAFTPLSEVEPTMDGPFRKAASRAASGDWGDLQRLFERAGANIVSIDEVVRTIVRRLIETDGSAPIAVLAAEVGLSPRQARRRFERVVGLSPKAFARVRRVRRACADAISEMTTLSDISLEAGFADQSHLSKSFQSVFELPPGKVRAYIRRIGHGDVFSA